METIFKTGYLKILRLFYEDKKARIHLRDIARRTKLNENSATRFLKELEKEEILISEKDGNLKKYRIVKNEKTAYIFTFFDIERFEKLPQLRKRAVNYFLDKLSEKPVIAVLFGSTAKQTFRKDSDIDILLIINKKIDIEKSKDYVNSQTGLRINCFQIDYKDFLKELKLKQDNVIQSSLNKGYPVFNQMLFYEVFINGN